MATTSRSDDVLEPVIVAIGGPTRAGKSSLARALNAHFGDASKLLTVEDFIIPDNLKLPRVSLGGKEIVNWVRLDALLLMRKSEMQAVNFKFYFSPCPQEHPDCHDWPRMEAELDGLIATANAAGRPHRRPVIVIEGFVVFQHAPFVHRSHVKFFVSASETTCRERRMKTTRVEENYWEQLVWPCYLQYGQLPPGDCAGSMHAAHCFDSNATSSDAIAAQAIAVVEAIARVAVRPFRDSDFEQVAATFLECEPARALGIALYSDKLYVQDVVIEKVLHEMSYS